MALEKIAPGLITKIHENYDILKNHLQITKTVSDNKWNWISTNTLTAQEIAAFNSRGKMEITVAYPPFITDKEHWSSIWCHYIMGKAVGIGETADGLDKCDDERRNSIDALEFIQTAFITTPFKRPSQHLPRDEITVNTVTLIPSHYTTQQFLAELVESDMCPRCTQEVAIRKCAVCGIKCCHVCPCEICPVCSATGRFAGLPLPLPTTFPYHIQQAIKRDGLRGVTKCGTAPKQNTNIPTQDDLNDLNDAMDKSNSCREDCQHDKQFYYKDNDGRNELYRALYGADAGEAEIDQEEIKRILFNIISKTHHPSEEGVDDFDILQEALDASDPGEEANGEPEGREGEPEGREGEPEGREGVQEGREEVQEGREEVQEGREEVQEGREEVQEEVDKKKEEEVDRKEQEGREGEPEEVDKKKEEEVDKKKEEEVDKKKEEEVDRKEQEGREGEPEEVDKKKEEEVDKKKEEEVDKKKEEEVDKKKEEEVDRKEQEGREGEPEEVDKKKEEEVDKKKEEEVDRKEQEASASHSAGSYSSASRRE